MSTEEQFFYDHAGWSYNPATETPEQGRRSGAHLLAQAGQWASDKGVTFGWEDDWSIDHVKEFDTYTENPNTCESCAAFGPDGEVLASLGCIDDATNDYRRVIEAELALEAQAELLSPSWSQRGC